MNIMTRLLSLGASGGIKRLNLTYNSDELTVLSRRLGKTSRVTVHVDKGDLTYIKVTNPYAGTLIHVPCTTSHRYVTGLTEHLQKLNLKLMRQRSPKKNLRLGELVEAREELRHLVIKQVASAKAARRRIAMRAELEFEDECREIQ
jgi:hypothetical protein